MSDKDDGWPDPPYYAEDMARLLRDAADQAPFRIQGGPEYCNGLRRAASLVEEFGVHSAPETCRRCGVALPDGAVTCPFSDEDCPARVEATT